MQLARDREGMIAAMAPLAALIRSPRQTENRNFRRYLPPVMTKRVTAAVDAAPLRSSRHS